MSRSWVQIVFKPLLRLAFRWRHGVSVERFLADWRAGRLPPEMPVEMIQQAKKLR